MKMKQTENGYNYSEIVYANGEIYKIGLKIPSGDYTKSDNVSTKQEDGCISTYHTSDSKFLDPVYPFYAVKEYPDGRKYLKYYYPSRDICKVIFGENTANGKDLSKYNLSKDVDIWVGIGLYQQEQSSYDIVFSISHNEQLRKISEYYNLKYPLPDGMSIETDDWYSPDFKYLTRWSYNPDAKYNNSFKLGSIKFKNDKPFLLKMYQTELS